MVSLNSPPENNNGSNLPWIWIFWFYFGNTCLYWLTGWHNLSYVTPTHLAMLSPLTTSISWIFIIVTFFGYFAFLSFIPGLLISLPIALFFPRRTIFLPISVVISSLTTTLFWIDCFVFARYHFHINGLLLNLFFSATRDQIFDFSWIEYGIAIGMFFGLLLIESIYAHWLWKKIIKNSTTITHSHCEKNLIWFLFSCFILSYLMLLFSVVQPGFQVISQQPQAFPLYNNFMTPLMPWKSRLQDLELIGFGQYNQIDRIEHPLRYPLHPLHCKKPEKPLNLLIIAIDSWRFDTLAPTIMPHLTEFSRHTSRFTHHLSGGNGTQPGIFSLFYGLLPSYWTAMLKQHRSPLLIEQLLKNHYQLGIFASAPLNAPAFNETIFQAIPQLPIKTPGENAQERDRTITRQFIQFLNQRTSSQPFFGFLFYDAAHSFCDGKNTQFPFSPTMEYCNRFSLDHKTIPYLNRYKNALFLIDERIEQVLQQLKKKQLLDNTVVIITGDHGEEFNDSGQEYFGHASNFTRYQLQTPLIIHWPGESPVIWSHQTSHYDIVATLMTKLHQCTNPPTDYSMGKLLTTPSKTDYLISCGYVDCGIIEAHQITRIFSTGNFKIDDLQERAMPNPTLHPTILKQVFLDFERFFQKEVRYDQKQQ